MLKKLLLKNNFETKKTFLNDDGEMAELLEKRTYKAFVLED